MKKKPKNNMWEKWSEKPDFKGNLEIWIKHHYMCIVCESPHFGHLTLV